MYHLYSFLFVNFQEFWRNNTIKPKADNLKRRPHDLNLKPDIFDEDYNEDYGEDYDEDGATSNSTRKKKMISQNVVS